MKERLSEEQVYRMIAEAEARLREAEQMLLYRPSDKDLVMRRQFELEAIRTAIMTPVEPEPIDDYIPDIDDEEY